MSSKAEYNFSKNFSDKQVQAIVEVRDSDLGKTWTVIAKQLNSRWKTSHNEKVYAGIYRRYAEEIRAAASKEPHPHEDFTREAMGEIVRRNKTKTKRFFVTAVGASSELHEKGFAAVQSFCKRRQADLVLLPMRAHVRALRGQPLHYDPKLKPLKDKFSTEYVFNVHLKAVELQINPQQVVPLSGLHRIRGRSEEFFEEEAGLSDAFLRNHRKISIIVAHSKQMMEVHPTGNDSTPRLLHSTGAITKADYLRDTRVGIIANEDHVLGGLIVEVDGDKFHLRQVQINPRDGSFVDLGDRFHADGRVTKERAEAFVMGDIHPGYHSDVALQTWHEVWKATKPKRVFLHDWWDGLSISHHVEKKNITKARRPEWAQSLKAEFALAKQVLQDVVKKTPDDCEVFAVASNHPDHLRRYLDEGRYIHDPVNYELAHRLVVMTLDGIDPLRAMLDPDDQITFLGREDDVIIEGTQCGSHGDMGLNGSKSSNKLNEKVYSSAMVGHSHTPSIFHDLFTVGHSTSPRHGYNQGASTWLWCSGLIYKGGHKQLVISIDGQWRLR